MSSSRSSNSYDWLNDPRYITLVVTDMSAFQGQQGAAKYPVKYIGGFYVTAWDIGSWQGGATQGCGDNDPALNGQSGDSQLWGHFVKQVLFASVGIPVVELCDFDGVGTCIAVLVE